MFYNLTNFTFNSHGQSLLCLSLNIICDVGYIIFLYLIAKTAHLDEIRIIDLHTLRVIFRNHGNCCFLVAMGSC